MSRISYSANEIALLHDLTGYIKEQATGLPKGEYVTDAVREGIKIKSEMIDKILKTGVIENE